MLRLLGGSRDENTAIEDSRLLSRPHSSSTVSSQWTCTLLAPAGEWD